MQRTFMPGTRHEPNTAACIPKISSKLQTGLKQKAALFDVTDGVRGGAGDLWALQGLGSGAAASLTPDAPHGIPTAPSMLSHC